MERGPGFSSSHGFQLSLTGGFSSQPLALPWQDSGITLSSAFRSNLELCLGYPKSWPVILPFRTPELLQNPGDPEALGTRMPSIHPFSRPWATRAHQAADAMDQPDHLDILLSGGDPPSTHAQHDLILWLQSGESHSQFGIHLSREVLTMGTQTYLGTSTPRCLIPGLLGPSKQDFRIPLISGFRGEQEPLSRAGLGHWQMPGFSQMPVIRDPAPPEPLRNQVLARHLVAARPGGIPSGTTELAGPACAVCSAAPDPPEQRRLSHPGSQLSLIGRTRVSLVSLRPGKTRNASRSNRRHWLGYLLGLFRDCGSLKKNPRR